MLEVMIDMLDRFCPYCVYVKHIHICIMFMSYKDSCSNFEELLLLKANTVSIHHKNLQLLATEIVKAQKNLNPSSMNKIFDEKDTPYTLRSGRNILTPKPSTTRYGLNMHAFSERRYGVQCHLKEPQTLNSFKRGIKNHQFDCNCRLCKRFVENLGFL